MMLKHASRIWMAALVAAAGLAAAASATPDWRMPRWIVTLAQSSLAAEAACRCQRSRRPDGTTALHWAARWDDLEMADLLIRAGANVKAANRFGATPLSLACMNGSAAGDREAAEGR